MPGGDLDDKSELLFTHNPAQEKVPVLLHGDRAAVCEWLVIVEYVDETFDGPPLLPADSHGRAMARFWARFVDDKCSMSMWGALIWMIAGQAHSEPAKTVKDNLTLLEKQLPEGKRFFGGETIGYLDIAVGGITLWLGVFEEVAGVPLLTEEKHPALCRWVREYAADETVKWCLPERGHLVAALTARKEQYVGLAKPAVPHAPK
ncbi:hypothetical protein ACQ4PT_043498 [Festuca glaucescens]